MSVQVLTGEAGDFVEVGDVIIRDALCRVTNVNLMCMIISVMTHCPSSGLRSASSVLIVVNPDFVMIKNLACRYPITVVRRKDDK